MTKIKEIIKKYFTLVKYIFSSGTSFLIDILLFTLFEILFKNIIYATILARIVSSLFNYLLNRKLVFKSDSNKYKSLLEYYLLVIMQMLISAFVVDNLYNLVNINPTIIKIPIEIILFMINYVFQKYIIFNNKRNDYSIIKSILLSIISVIAVVGNLDIYKSNSYIEIFKSVELIVYFILLIFFFFIYNNLYKEKKLNKLYNLFAIVISFLIVLFCSYNHLATGALLFSSFINIIISLVKIVGLYYVIRLLITYIDEFITKKIKIKKSNNKLINLFLKYPFICSFIFLMICYSIYIIAFYPGIINYDNANQIKEVLGLHTRYLDAIIPLSNSVTITNFNPVLHTLLLGNLVKLGINLGSFNLGLFFYTFIQLLIVISTYSYIIKYLVKEKVNVIVVLISLIILGIIPVFGFYSITAVKDVIYACFLLLFTLKLYDMIKYKKESIKDYIVLFLISLLVILFRNNGLYAVILTIPFMLFIVRKKTPLIITILLLFGFNYSYQNILLPKLNISNTSVREMLSIPFQQTARMVKYHEKDISKNDKLVIDKILDYDTLASRYESDLADPVKNKFNRYYTKDDLNNYYKVWARGLIKRPLTYIDATINNTKGYVNPFEKEWVIYFKLNPKLPEAGYQYHYNKLNSLRTVLVDYEYATEYIPVLNIFTNVGMITLLSILLYCSLFIYKKYKYLIFMTPSIIQILVCIASPCNACFRYVYPSLLILVLFIPLINKIITSKD